MYIYLYYSLLLKTFRNIMSHYDGLTITGTEDRDSRFHCHRCFATVILTQCWESPHSDRTEIYQHRLNGPRASKTRIKLHWSNDNWSMKHWSSRHQHLLRRRGIGRHLGAGGKKKAASEVLRKTRTSLVWVICSVCTQQGLATDPCLGQSFTLYPTGPRTW